MTAAKDFATLADELSALVAPMSGCKLEATNGDAWYADLDRQGEWAQVHVASGEASFIAASVALVNAAPQIIEDQFAALKLHLTRHPCPSTSKSGKRRASTAYAGSTTENALTEALTLARQQRQTKSGKRSNAKSSSASSSERLRSGVQSSPAAPAFPLVLAKTHASRLSLFAGTGRESAVPSGQSAGNPFPLHPVNTLPLPQYGEMK